MQATTKLNKGVSAHKKTYLAALLLTCSLTAIAQTTTSTSPAVPATAPATPKGEIMGTAWVHTAETLLASAQLADVVLPAKATGGAVFTGNAHQLDAMLKR
ncbi:MAG TPA: hypothetical protein PK702_10485, partial [Burkholderiaceae bacterium]|nr:hypothetical protein [Burkholderiaceae bacterium]